MRSFLDDLIPHEERIDTRKVQFAVIALFVSIVFVTASATLVKAEMPTIWTDKPDYSPEQIVTIFGSGFNTLANITVTVDRPDGTVNATYALADDAGNFTCTYQLDGITGTYLVTATDGTNTATTTFTDTSYPTTTTLNALPTTLLAGQTYKFNGTVTTTPPNPAVPGGAPVVLQCSDDGTHWNAPPHLKFEVSVSTQSGGAFNGTFTAPSAPGTYYFRAHFAQYNVGGGNNYHSSDSTIQSRTIAQGYTLTIATNPSSIDSTTGSGVYAAGAVVSISAPVDVDIISGQSRYHFTDWSGTSIDNASAASTTVTMGAAAKTVTANYVTQYNVTVVSDHDTPTASRWVDQGGSLTASVTSPADTVTNDHQWICTGYSIDGGAAQAGTSYPFTNIQSAHTIVFNWKEQFWITVDNGGHGTPSVGSGWADQGSSFSTTVSSPTEVVAGDHQWVCEQTTLSIADVQAPQTLTFTWTEQFWLTVTSTHDTPSGDGWYNNGSKAYATLSSGTILDGTDIKYVFTSWSGDASGTNYASSDAITMIGPKTATANWNTYYRVTFTETGLTSDATGTILSVGSNNYTYSDFTSGSLTVWADDQAAYSWTTIVPGAANERFVTAANSGTVTSASSGDSASYQQQWQIPASYSTSDGTTPSANVVLSGTQSGNTAFTLTLTTTVQNVWLDAASTWSVNNPIPDSPTTERWIATSGTSGTVDSTTVVAPDYYHQFNVTFAQDGVGSDFTGTVVIIDELNYNVTDLSASFWWNANSVHSFAFETYLDVNSTTRYVYYETLGLSTAQSDSSLAITASGTITGYYGIEYLVTFDQTGINGDFSGNVVKVDGANYTKGSLPVALWLNAEQTHSFNFYSPLSVGTNKQYVWNSTTGLSTLQSNSSFTVTQAGSVTGKYYNAVLTYTGATTGQYSDPVTVNATLTNSTGKISGITITFTIGTQSKTATTNSLGIASTTIILTQPSGSYTVTASCAGASGTTLSDSKAFTISKETLDITYTGDVFDVTNGANSMLVKFSASLVQDPDGYPGDLTRANVTFAVFKSSNLGSTPDYQFKASSNATGWAQVYGSLVPDIYTIYVRLNPSNNTYWQANQVPVAVLTVTISSTSSVTGGGWIPDSLSSNGKGNFGFTVQYNKNQAPKGSFVYVYRGLDGYTYIVKSNSWQGGYLAFTANNKAYFTGKCVIQKVDPSTGALVDSWGGSRFGVYITDNDQGGKQNTGTDTIAISFSTPTYVDDYTTRTIGTANSQITLGGGNIVVHTK